MRRGSVSAGAILWLLCVHSSAQETSKAEALVLQAEDKLSRATSTVAANMGETLQSLLSPDFTGIDTNGRVSDKTDWLSYYRNIASDRERKASWTAAVAAYSTEERKVTVRDGIAVVTGWRKRADGGHRFTHVWVKREGDWHLSLSQSTLIFPYPSALVSGDPNSPKIR